jgi:hypothetical protein
VGLGHLKTSTLKIQFENCEREAGFARCDDPAEAMRHVFGEMTMP